ncbi:MAG: SDR family oxidoreductase [Myxococcales bacterium]|jgi:thioester reductase-like protein|nr:SDR family oxidoreductase [Myxococcales bacterium]
MKRGYEEVVLLTGFPSFAARKMLEELVRSGPRTFVHAVVRAKFADEAEEALLALTFDERKRVNLIEGDAAAMDLGLSGKEYLEVAREIDRIHHVAHVSYLGAPKGVAEEVNVGGAREILEIAEVAPDLRALVFHSTALVSGNRTGLVREDELERGQSFKNVVEETRAHAEVLVQRRVKSLPIVVLRPTTIVGDSATGEVDRFDGPYLLVLLMLTSPPDLALPFPGRGDALLHLVPVDYVTRAARALGLDPRAVGRTFHLADPSPLPARRVFELVARAGGRPAPRGFIPANLTKAILKTPGLDRIAQSPRAFLEALATPVSYSTAGTTELLVDKGIQCPPFETYVDKIVTYVEQRLREKRARRDVDAPDPLV